MNPKTFAALFACAALPAAAAHLPFDDAVTVVRADQGIDDVAHADLDGDGFVDLVYASQGDAAVFWARGRGGTYSQPDRIVDRPVIRRVVAADFDLDGRIDLVTASLGGTLIFHRGLHDDAVVPQYQTFPALSASAGTISALAVGDTNADGRPDLVVARNSTLQVHVFNGAAATRFSAAQNVPTTPNSLAIASLALADFDANGLVDVAYASNAVAGASVEHRQVVIVPRSSAGAFGTPVTVAGSSGPRAEGSQQLGSLVAGEFNRFEGVDLAWISNRPESTSRVVVARHAGPPSLIFDVIEPFASTAAIVSIDALDADRDGDDDLGLVLSGQPAAAWLQNSGGAFPFRTPRAAAAVPDLIGGFFEDDDRDGDLDRLLVRSDRILRAPNRRIHGRVQLVANAKGGEAFSGSAALDGPFAIETRRFGRTPGRQIVFTEFNNGTVQTARVREGFGQGYGIDVDDTPLITDVGGARDLAVSDFDHDGDDDLVLATGVGGPPANNSRLVLHRAGATPVTQVLACNQGEDIRGVAIGEVFNPGLGIVYASEDNDRVAIAQECPIEALVSTSANGATNGPNSVKLGDIDGDGDLDIAVAARGGDSGALAGNFFGWYPNTGLGAFGALQRVAVHEGAREITLVDFNRDGHMDLIGSTGGEVRIYTGLRGQFGAPIVAATGIDAPGRVVAHDVDFDGDFDLLVPSESTGAIGANRTHCGISLIENTGGGFRAPACVDPRPDDPVQWSRLAVDDLDLDGDVDVVATSFPQDRVGAVDLGLPAPYVTTRTSTVQDRVLIDRPGVELCHVTIDIEHQGRAGDSDLEAALFRFRFSGQINAQLFAQAVLRRDAGGQPSPGPAGEILRQQVTRAGETEMRVNGLRVSPGATPLRVWLCLVTMSPLPVAGVRHVVELPTVLARDVFDNEFALGATLGDDQPEYATVRIFANSLE